MAAEQKRLLSLLERIVVQLVGMAAMAAVGLLLSRTPSLASFLSPPSPLPHAATILAMVERGGGGGGLSSVGGNEAAKEKLRRGVVLPLKHPSLFFDPSTPSLRPPRGTLLHGPPGTGKTMLARACASESGASFLPLHPAALENKYWGESPKILQAAFSLARTKLAPCVLFFDEVDGMGRERSEQDQSCVYAMKCELLRNMDAVGDAPVAVLACTNCPRSLDPALRRRFAQKVEIPLPGRDEREAILRVLLEGEKGGKDDGLIHSLADATEGFSGADLASCHAEACAERVWATPLLSSPRAFSDLEKGGGKALLAKAGALTEAHWAASGRIRFLPQKTEPAKGG